MQKKMLNVNEQTFDAKLFKKILRKSIRRQRRNISVSFAEKFAFKTLGRKSFASSKRDPYLMLLLLLSLEFWPGCCCCCATGVDSLDWINLEFLDKPGDETMETLSRESPSERRLAVVLLCFSHMA